jgi:hypothetical protein
MKEALKELEKARKVVGEKFEALRKVCDHQDESGSWARVYNPYADKNVCQYCGEDL